MRWMEGWGYFEKVWVGLRWTARTRGMVVSGDWFRVARCSARAVRSGRSLWSGGGFRAAGFRKGEAGQEGNVAAVRLANCNAA